MIFAWNSQTWRRTVLTSVPSCLEKIAPIRFVLSPKIHSIRNQKDNASSPFPVRQLVTSCLHRDRDYWCACANNFDDHYQQHSKQWLLFVLYNGYCASKLAQISDSDSRFHTFNLTNLRDLRYKPAGDREHADHESEPLTNVHHTFSKVLEHPGRVHCGSQFWRTFRSIISYDGPANIVAHQTPRLVQRHRSPRVTPSCNDLSLNGNLAPKCSALELEVTITTLFM